MSVHRESPRIGHRVGLKAAGYRNRDRILLPPPRLVRFALLADDDADIDALRERIDLCLAVEAARYLPNLLRVASSFWQHHNRTGGRSAKRRSGKRHAPTPRKPKYPPYFVDQKTLKQRKQLVKAGRPPRIPFRLDPFLPDRKRLAPRLAPKLADYNFLILTLPIYEREFRRSHCRPTGALFDIAYILKRCCKLQSVSPDLQYPNYQTLSGLPANEGWPEATEDPAWHLANIHYYEAVPPGINGAGTVIGHPDTGWTPHTELNFTPDPPGSDNFTSPNFDLDRDVNIIDPSSVTAEERVPALEGGLPLRFPHHGTRTAGILISDNDPGRSSNRVFGVAPGATIVSIRCVDSVVLILDINVAQAIMAAVEAGVHVISISLGGYPAPILEWALKWAVAENIIVVAAAGNYYPLVVYPAAYQDCIAVGGSTVEDTVWDESARNWQLNAPITISAPAEGVTNPAWTEAGEEGTSRNEGTSFSAAIVAGAAALWLQRFDRDLLIAALDSRAPIQELFRAHLQASARHPAEWDELLDGPGILDMRRLMDPDLLPDPRVFSTIGPLDVLTRFPGVDEAAHWLEVIFGPEAQEAAVEFGEELVNIIMSNPVATAAVQIIEELASDIEEAADDTAEGVAEAVEDAAEDIAEAAEDFVDAAAEAASDGLAALGDFFGL